MDLLKIEFVVMAVKLWVQSSLLTEETSITDNIADAHFNQILVCILNHFEHCAAINLLLNLCSGFLVNHFVNDRKFL